MLENIDPCADAHAVEQGNDIRRAHADAAVADGDADIALLGCAVDVNEAAKAVPVVTLFAAEPEDAGDDGIASRRINRQHLAGETARLENRARRQTVPDFFQHAVLAERGAVAARPRTQPEFRGRDGKGGHGLTLISDEHLLVGHADVHDMTVVELRTAGKKQGEGKKNRTNPHRETTT